MGVSSSGTREILAVELMFDESDNSWREFFRLLKKRGLKRVSLCISDAHAGIQAAVKKEILGANWQRCKAHFMPNILAKAPHMEKCRCHGSDGYGMLWFENHAKYGEVNESAAGPVRTGDLRIRRPTV